MCIDSNNSCLSHIGLLGLVTKVDGVNNMSKIDIRKYSVPNILQTLNFKTGSNITRQDKNIQTGQTGHR
jgi:hypothetical protein